MGLREIKIGSVWEAKNGHWFQVWCVSNVGGDMPDMDKNNMVVMKSMTTTGYYTMNSLLFPGDMIPVEVRDE